MVIDYNGYLSNLLLLKIANKVGVKNKEIIECFDKIETYRKADRVREKTISDRKHGFWGRKK